MSLPSLQATSGNLIRDGLYTQAQIHADPETQALIPTLEPAQASLEKAVDGRRAADKAAIMAAAAADYRLGSLQRAIVVFGAKVYGHFANRTDEHYLRLLPHSASEIAMANPSDRATTYAALRKESLDPATPKELAPAVKVLVAAIDEWSAATATSDKADAALKAAGKTEASVADAWQTAVRKLRGQLIALFPRDLRRQRSYFPAAKAPRKPKKATADV